MTNGVDSQSQPLLGYSDGAILADEDSQSPFVNKLGGKGAWLSKGEPPPTTLLSPCQICSKRLFLVAQIYSALEYSDHHRVLYIFVCNTKTCASQEKGWRVIRGHKLENASRAFSPQYEVLKAKDKTETSERDLFSVRPNNDVGQVRGQGREPVVPALNEQAKLTSVSDEWTMGASASPFGQSPFGGGSMSMLGFGVADSPAVPTMRADPVIKTDKAIGTSPATLPTETKKPNEHVDPVEFGSFCPLYLNVDQEYLTSSDEATTHEKKLLNEYEKWQGAVDTSGAEGWSGEGYEKTRLKHISKSFKNFLQTVAHNPQQCIRYHRGGTPLLYDDDAVAKKIKDHQIPACSRCNGPRIFELQLMPALLCILKVDESTASSGGKSMDDKVKPMDVEAMDWGTVLIYTCHKSCQESGTRATSASYYEEFAAVQVER